MQLSAAGNRRAFIPFVSTISIARRGIIPLTVEDAPSPLPLTMIPETLTLPKHFEMSEVPGVRGAIAPESVFSPFEITYRGTLLADTAPELRDIIDDVLEWFEGAIRIELIPGRFCYGHVSQHTLDPKWVGTNDTFIAFSFQVSVPDAQFFDADGNTYRTP